MAIQISPNGRLMTIQTNDSSYQMLADKMECFFIYIMEAVLVQRTYLILLLEVMLVFLEIRGSRTGPHIFT